MHGSSEPHPSKNLLPATTCPVILSKSQALPAWGGSSVHQREITAVKMPGFCVDGQCLLSTCCMPGSFPATLASLIQLILPPTLGAAYCSLLPCLPQDGEVTPHRPWQGANEIMEENYFGQGNLVGFPGGSEVKNPPAK